MVLDGQRMGDERDWVLVGFFVTCSSSAEKRFIRPAKQDEMAGAVKCPPAVIMTASVPCRASMQAHRAKVLLVRPPPHHLHAKILAR